MTPSEIRVRILAVSVGIGLMLIGATVSIQLLGENELLLFISDIAMYSLAAFLLSFFWPDGGWRLGLYLFAVWPPSLLFGLFLSWEQHPTNQRAQLMELFGYFLIGVGACVGAGCGAVIGRRINNRNGSTLF